MARPKSTVEMTSVTFRLPKELKWRLDAVAYSAAREIDPNILPGEVNMSAFIVDGVADAVDKQEAASGLTAQELADQKRLGEMAFLQARMDELG